ncbi:MAG: NifU family protein [Abditibacteriota bacterium]|nr:NifU family protein [Abditibacteriota bacterium]
MKAKVEEAIAKVRPALQADGGDVELVELDGNVAKVRLQGCTFYFIMYNSVF